MSVIMSATEVSHGDQKLCFIIGALMFFAIPIRIQHPESRTQRQFRHFIITFNRTYNGNETEYERRYQIFKKTFDRIEDLRHDSRHVFGINRYSDMSPTEFSDRYLLQGVHLYRPPRMKRKVSTALHRYYQKNLGNASIPLPRRVDWRKTGIITQVRHQGKCGSCYAQSVIATVEAMSALKSNSTNAEELSVQQMIDCAENLNFGCKGGDTCLLLQWLKKENVSILSEEYYPESEGERSCHMESSLEDLPPSARTVRVTDYTCFNFVNQEPEMLEYLAFKGPLIASVSALPWKHYVGGVIKRDCTGPADHAVQIVGYDLGGQEEPHFIVRNSWGTGFGLDGYVKIAIGGNVCGIAEEVSSVTVD